MGVEGGESEGVSGKRLLKFHDKCLSSHSLPSVVCLFPTSPIAAVLFDGGAWVILKT